jgi:hypothetical protein
MGGSGCEPFGRLTEFLEPSSGVLLFLPELVMSMNRLGPEGSLHNVQEIGSYIHQNALMMMMTMTMTMIIICSSLFYLLRPVKDLPTFQKQSVNKN